MYFLITCTFCICLLSTCIYSEDCPLASGGSGWVDCDDFSSLPQFVLLSWPTRVNRSRAVLYLTKYRNYEKIDREWREHMYKEMSISNVNNNNNNIIISEEMFLDSLLMCIFQERFLSILTPRDFILDTWFIGAPSIANDTFYAVFVNSSYIVLSSERYKKYYK